MEKETRNLWVPCLHQKEMFSLNWVVKGEDFVLDFKNDEIELGCDSLINLEVSDAKVREAGVEFDIDGGGCLECGGSESYFLVMKENRSSKTKRIDIESKVMCGCHDVEYSVVEEHPYIAIPKLQI